MPGASARLNGAKLVPPGPGLTSAVTAVSYTHLVYADRSGPVLVELLQAAGCEVDGPQVVADGDPVEKALRDGLKAGYDVIVTTGGTGLTPLDLTPEMTRRCV